jgi:hypothetical protein
MLYLLGLSIKAFFLKSNRDRGFMAENTKMEKDLVEKKNISNAAEYRETGRMSLAMSIFVDDNGKENMLSMKCPPEEALPRLLDPTRFPNLESSPATNVLMRCQQNYIKAAKPQNGSETPGR